MVVDGLEGRVKFLEQKLDVMGGVVQMLVDELRDKGLIDFKKWR